MNRAEREGSIQVSLPPPPAPPFRLLHQRTGRKSPSKVGLSSIMAADFSHKWIAASVQVPRSGFATALVQNWFGFIDLGAIAGFAGRLRLNATPPSFYFPGPWRRRPRKNLYKSIWFVAACHPIRKVLPGSLGRGRCGSPRS
jgi:hypothetical protein